MSSQFFVFNSQTGEQIFQIQQACDVIAAMLVYLDEEEPLQHIKLFAIQKFETLLAETPELEHYLSSNYEKFFYQIGNIYYELKEYVKAIDCFNRASYLNPSNQNAIVYRYDCYEQQADKENMDVNNELNTALEHIRTNISEGETYKAQYEEEYEEQHNGEQISSRKKNKLYKQVDNAVSENISLILDLTPQALDHLSENLVLNSLARFYANIQEYQRAIDCLTVFVKNSQNGKINDYRCDLIHTYRFRAWLFRQLGNTEGAEQDVAEVTRLRAYQGIPLQKISTENVQLGLGAFGTVCKGSLGQQAVAVKTMQGRENLDYWQYHHEIEILSKLDHPNIIEFAGHHRNPQNNGTMIILTKLMKCSLSILLDSNNQLNWEFRLKIAGEFLQGLAYLHQQQIIHRDLKSDNILVDENNHIKIADFGSAEDQKNSSFYHYLLQHAEVGSWAYWAPELFKDKTYSEQTDVWAAALILWQIASHKKPHKAYETKEQLKNELENGIRESFPLLDTPVAYSALVHRGWSLNPAHRPSARTMAQDATEIAAEEQSMRGLKG